MEMKLSGTRIKELRLKLSWSQEKLAEQAGLNPRTVQRAETEGSASLRTRLQLAEALQVQPEDLDAELAAPCRQAAGVTSKTQDDTSLYYWAVLLLISLVYLACQPAYLSLSVANFSWGNEPRGEASAWLLVCTITWLLVAGPVLYTLRRKHGALFVPYLAAFGLALALTASRIWQPEPAWIAAGLTVVLSLSGFALLLSLYLPHLETRLLRHVACMCLTVYVFLWFFNVVIGFITGTYSFVAAGRTLSEVAPVWYVAGSLMRAAGKLVQLIPIGLVLILSLGRRPA